MPVEVGEKYFKVGDAVSLFKTAKHHPILKSGEAFFEVKIKDSEKLIITQISQKPNCRPYYDVEYQGRLFFLSDDYVRAYNPDEKLPRKRRPVGFKPGMCVFTKTDKKCVVYSKTPKYNGNYYERTEVIVPAKTLLNVLSQTGNRHQDEFVFQFGEDSRFVAYAEDVTILIDYDGRYDVPSKNQHTHVDQLFYKVRQISTGEYFTGGHKWNVAFSKLGLLYTTLSQARQGYNSITKRNPDAAGTVEIVEFNLGETRLIPEKTTKLKTL